MAKAVSSELRDSSEAERRGTGRLKAIEYAAELDPLSTTGVRSFARNDDHGKRLLYAGSSSIAIANPVHDVINAFTPKCGGSFGFVGTTCTPTTLASETTGTSTALGAATRAIAMDGPRACGDH